MNRAETDWASSVHERGWRGCSPMGQAQVGGDMARSNEGMRIARVPARTHLREAVNAPGTSGRGSDRAKPLCSMQSEQGAAQSSEDGRRGAGSGRRQEGLGDDEASEGGGAR